MQSLSPNSTFAARYQVVRCIAAGGMGAVYEVVHVETERRRALKVMHAHFVGSAELRERFKREAKVAAQIDSEFVVDVFDAGIDEATSMPFLVMELLKGEELGKRLAAVGRFAPAEAITYLWQTALALDKTHKANIVHRDLKPENLFLTEREDGPPRIKVLDFGVAKFIAETGTQSGQTRSLGTPLYMAPEQFRGQRVTAQADHFALAMMAYTLLVGTPYWGEEAGGDTDVVAFALRAHAGPLESARARAARAGVAMPEAFDAWFSKATATDPSARFASATQTITTLGDVYGIQPAMITGVAASDPFRPSVGLGSSHSGPSRPSLGPGISQSGLSRPSLGPGTVAMVPWTGNVAVVTTPGPRAPHRHRGLALVAVAVTIAAAVAVAVWFFARRPADERTAARAADTTAPPSPAVSAPPIATTSAAEVEAHVPSAPVPDTPIDANPPSASSPAASAPPRPAPGNGRPATKLGLSAAPPSPSPSPSALTPKQPPPPPTYSRD
ncbi:MAG: serine/threonine-protein kinase [Polyangiaceae bacterium]